MPTAFVDSFFVSFLRQRPTSLLRLLTMYLDTRRDPYSGFHSVLFSKSSAFHISVCPPPFCLFSAAAQIAELLCASLSGQILTVSLLGSFLRFPRWLPSARPLLVLLTLPWPMLRSEQSPQKVDAVFFSAFSFVDTTLSMKRMPPPSTALRELRKVREESFSKSKPFLRLFNLVKVFRSRKSPTFRMSLTMLW